MRTLTPAAISTFAYCPRRYELAYLLKIQPIIYNSSITVLKSLRAGIEEIQTTTKWKPIPDAMLAAYGAIKEDLLKLRSWMDDDEFIETVEQAKRDRAKVYAMLRAYREVYSKSLSMVRTSSSFKVRPLINPLTGKRSRTFNLSGAYDGVYKLDDGRLMVYFVISTSESVRESSRILAQSIQPQLSMAMIPDLEKMAGVCVDIVKKPVIQFRRASAKKIDMEREPLDDYEERAYEAYLKRPDHFFRRIKIPIIPENIREAGRVAWRVAQDIRDSDKHGYLACRGVNCKNHKGWCDYQNLCWYASHENYKHGQFAHEELGLAE